MIKINGPSETPHSPKARKTSRAGSTFSPATQSAGDGAGVSGASQAAPSALLDALIDLQGAGGGSAKTYAAGQRTLDLLEKMQIQILDGEASNADLEALSQAAKVRARADAAPGLIEVYDQIALRARVELAKRKR